MGKKFLKDKKDTTLGNIIKTAKNKEIIDSIVELKELKELLRPLNNQERDLLEEDIVLNGCKDSIILWKNGEQHVLVDGHNRREICLRNNIPFDFLFRNFQNIEEVKSFMITSQLAKRNLNDLEIALFIGNTYYIKKESKQNKNETNIAKELSGLFKTAEKTVTRNFHFYLGMKKIKEYNVDLYTEVLEKKSNLTKAMITELGRNENITFEDFYYPKNTLLKVKTDQKKETKKNPFSKWYDGYSKKVLKVIEKGNKKELQDEKIEIEKKIVKLNELLKVLDSE